jgi:hypothetical protein
MPTASALRLQIENALEQRFPAALTPVPRTIRETAATGIAEVDRLLDGGLPVGAISEVTGPESSGRTSLALAFVSERTRQGQVCAWVDAHDALDVESAAANGVRLKQLLWVRCRGAAAAKQASGGEDAARTAGLETGATSRVNLPIGAKQSAEKVQYSGTIDEKHTSGAKAHRLFSAACGTTEVVPCYKTAAEWSLSAACKAGVDPVGFMRGLKPPPPSAPNFSADRKNKPWPRLEQALRATDLLLQAGGFAALVLDLGGTAAEHGCRIPLATWFRFRQAADRTRCSLLVLAREPLAQSSAAVVLECAAERAAQEGGTVLSGCSYQVRRGRQRFAAERFTGKIAEVCKPPLSTWQADGPWQREKLQKNSSTKQDVVMEFYGVPPIGQKQERPMDGAQLHSARAGGRLG